MATSVLGLYGTSKAPYGSFAGKVANTAVELAAYARGAITDAVVYARGAMDGTSYGLGAMDGIGYAAGGIDPDHAHTRGTMAGDAEYGQGDVD